MDIIDISDFQVGVKERLLKFIKSKGLTVKAFEQRCGMSNGYVNAMRKGLGPQKLERVLKEFPDLNKHWLLFGGYIVEPRDRKTDIEDILRNFRWPAGISSKNTYKSSNYTEFKLRHVGIRIAEICNIKGVRQQSFAEKMRFDYAKLTEIIRGKEPAPEELLAKILATYPDINPCWLYTGVGNPLDF